jgi:hypothetical protein
MIQRQQDQAPDNNHTNHNNQSELFRRLVFPVMCLVSLFGFGVDKGFRELNNHLKDNLAGRIAKTLDNSISFEELSSKLHILSTASVRLETERISHAEYIKYSAECIKKELGHKNVYARDLINELKQLSKALDTNYQPGKDNLVNEPAKTALELLNKLLPPDSL